ncbi:MAG: hypothetical protein M0Z45_06855 [Actinomycetota bacterium]|nr:hypothetical protein [Actinomycetota bacterium]
MASQFKKTALQELCKVVRVVNRLANERFEETVTDLAYRGRVATQKRVDAVRKVKDEVESYLGISR